MKRPRKSRGAPPKNAARAHYDQLMKQGMGKAVRGSHILNALRNAADGPSRRPARPAASEAGGEEPVTDGFVVLPSTIPKACPVSRSTVVVIHGSCRIHVLE